jgi:1,4-alpha-glucan branching enzyme
MALKKQFVKTKPVCKVTFSIDAKDAGTVAVVGDFNNWNANEGTYDLVKDAIYEFKYVIDGIYVNEPEADSYRWNDYAGSENSVLVI